MTGFGRGEATLGRATLVVEARTVNHRYCEVRSSWPRALGLPPGFGDEVVKRRVERGRVEVHGVVTGEPAENAVTDLAERVAPLVALRDRLDPGGPIPWALAPLLPPAEAKREAGSNAEIERAASAALSAALDALDEMRSREGQALEDELRRLAFEVGGQLAAARAEADERPERAMTRLRERIAVLLEGREDAVDASRLELEIALLADRTDVTEELSRLEAHLTELGAQLEREGQLGRRIDFLLQEMNREVNTLGAKSADGRLSRVVVELKSLLEKLREQTQNVL